MIKHNAGPLIRLLRLPGKQDHRVEKISTIAASIDDRGVESWPFRLESRTEIGGLPDILAASAGRPGPGPGPPPPGAWQKLGNRDS
jgi:hypothetical protein